MEKLKVMVVVGTRPEIIRLSEVIKAIDKYFELRHQTCSYETRTKIYALMATFALLWVSWSEAKRAEGQDFTEYAKGQYKYAQEYLQYVKERLRKKSA